MTTKQIAEIAAIVMQTMREEEQTTTDRMKGVGETVNKITKKAEAKPKKAKAKASTQ